jgi:putative ATP-binding cassette transporter
VETFVLMNLVFFLLRNSRRVAAFAVLAGVLSGLANVGLILLLHRAINPNHPLGRPHLPGGLLAWLFGGLCLAAALSRIVSQTLLARLSRRSVARLSRRLSERILATPLRDLEELGSARLMTMLTTDIPTIAQGLRAVPTLCINAVIILACLCFLAWLSPVVFFSILGLLAFTLAAQRLVGARAMKLIRSARGKRDSLTGHHQKLVEGVKELKVHRGRRDAFLNGPLRSTALALEKQDSGGQFLLALAQGGGRFLFFGLIGFLVFVLPHLREVDSQALHGYVIGMLFMLAPIQSFGTSLPPLVRARVALKRVRSLGKSLAVMDGQEAEQVEEAPSFTSLELAGVTHSYRRERDGTGFTLGPLHLALRPGEVVFVVGGNGSGKTTLVKLLVGLYHPEEGEIRLDGRPIGDTDREGYRRLFTVVFADVCLFESLLGLEHPALDSQALAYLSELHLEHKVKVQEGVLSTLHLSRGQQKRLALLTAYLEDRPIYVFDEWASDQDPLFKDVFYTRVLPRLKERGKLVLAVTHDDRYFPRADRLIHLEEGKVVPEKVATVENGFVNASGAR